MALTLHCGPHRSGRTTALLGLAHKVVLQGGLVWWIGLPTQRGAVYRRLTEHLGAVVGVEFLSFQQFTYRVLTAEQSVKPLLVGSARLVAVAEALLHTGGVPSPGEARLFNDAIAEAKRYGLTPADVANLAQNDPERVRFARVFQAYEANRGDYWDFDDARNALRARLATGTPLTTLEPNLIIVDGFREFAPTELEILRGLAQYVDIHVAVREESAGTKAAYTYEPIAVQTVEEYIAPNPVAELRYVFSRVKEQLMNGVAHSDIAIIVPEGHTHAALVLASEFGVPVHDEQPQTLAETYEGRLLATLLTFADTPTASHLLAIPALAPVAGELLTSNVAGADAVHIIAERAGVASEWQRWYDLLSADDASFSWANELVREVLPTLTPDLTPMWQNKALSAAQEAAKLGTGEAFREWWLALLEHTAERVDIPSGVPLLTTPRIANRQFRIAYVTGARRGAYSTFEHEDYFIPEELRFTTGEGLPVRYAGRDDDLFAELRTRAGHLVVTAPAADQGGGHPTEPQLLPNPLPLPPYQVGSALLPASEPYHAPLEPLALRPKPSVEFLQQYSVCPFRAWATRQLGIRDEEAQDRPWFTWRDELLAQEVLTERRIAELEAEYEPFGPWLRAHQDALTSYTYRPTLPGRHANAHLHAAKRVTKNGGTTVEFVHFVGPFAAPTEADAVSIMQDRWNEIWAAAGLLGRSGSTITDVYVTVWPLLGEPVAAFPYGLRANERRRERVVAEVQRVHAQYETGDVSPQPGFHCHTCPVFDTCREGVL